jgi:hypothetical protein
MKKLLCIPLALTAAALLLAGCAGERDTRTELYDENTYLRKDFLTRPSPLAIDPLTGQEDSGWLMGLTVTKVSVPTAITSVTLAVSPIVTVRPVRTSGLNPASSARRSYRPTGSTAKTNRPSDSLTSERVSPVSI